MKPSWRAERALWREGYQRVAGVDEVGRGPLAGPVTAGAVVMPLTPSGRVPRQGWMRRLRDSKLLSAAKREELAEEIKARCDWAVMAVSSQVVDQINVLKASHLAMRLAVEALTDSPDAVIIDGRDRLHLPVTQRPIVAADARCVSVAAASIVAKVERDRMMCELDGAFPGYGLAENKGYATAEHRAALQRLGSSSVHRLSFAPVRLAVGRQTG
jgi:ribonuclease HII